MNDLIKRDNQIVEFDISKIVLAIATAFESSCGSHSDDYLDNYQTYLRIISELDWPAYLLRSPELHEQVIQSFFQNNVDEIYTLLFAWCDNDFITSISKQCKQSSVIKFDRHRIINEATLLFRRGFFHATVSLLIPQLYGIALDISKYLSNAQIAIGENNSNLLTTRYKINNSSDKGQLISAILAGKELDNLTYEYDLLIGYLRTKVFSATLSESDMLAHPNRNLICHGKQLNYGTKEHALKAILCTFSLVKIANVLEEFVSV